MKIHSTTTASSARGRDLAVTQSGPGRYSIDTGRYTIDVKHGEVRIFDKQTRTWAKAWGDPHFHTGDGDRMQFHRDNLTIDLKDGTKVTIKPTAMNERGIALVDQVHVMKGSSGEVIRDISTKPVLWKGSGGARSVDNLLDDGTVLVAGHEVDDMRFSGQHAPIRHTGRNELLLDGRGGQSSLSFDRSTGIHGTLSQLQDGVDVQVQSIQDQMDHLNQLLMDPNLKANQRQKISSDLQRLMFDMQQMEQLKSALMQARVQLLKNESDTTMAIVRAWRVNG